LFKPRTTVRPLTGIDWSSTNPGKQYVNAVGGQFIVSKTPENAIERRFLDAGTNPPKGAVLTYFLKDVPEQPIKLSIADASGTVIRSFTSRNKPEPGKKPESELKLPTSAGFNRFIWDLRRSGPSKIEGSEPQFEGEVQGPRVPPGVYTLTLTVGEQEFTQNLTVVPEPAIASSADDLAAQYNLQVKIYDTLDKAVKGVNRMRDLRQQLDGWAKRVEKHEQGEALTTAIKGLREQVLAIEETLLVPDLRIGWADNLNKGVRLLQKLAELPSVVEMGDYRPTDVSYQVYEHLGGQIESQLKRFDELVARELAPLNKRIAEAGVGAVVVKQ
jgi:hypothetical protein